MAFQLSPGVNYSEIDLTTIVPAVGTTEGAFAGDFVWGPIDEVTNLSNEIELLNRFGPPTNSTFKSFFSSANFLSYAQRLRLVRAADTSVAKNATSGAAVLIKNRDDYEINYSNLATANSNGQWAAKFAGAKGSGLKVATLAASAGFSTWAYKSEFNGAPGTSNYAAGVGGSNDEMHVAVIDGAGKFTGVANTVLEKFAYVSKASDAVNDDGSSNYYVNVISNRSKFVLPLKHAQNTVTQVSETSTWGNTATGTAFAQTNNTYLSVLAGGADGIANTSNLATAYDKFKNGEQVDISLIITGAAPQTVSQHIVDNIAESRKDCVAFISPEYDDVVDNSGNEVADITAYRNLFNSSSYAFMDDNWKYQFDKYNNTYRWVPCNGDIAGLCVRTDFERDPWYSPAGFNRGHIKNVTKLAWNAEKADRDDLYKIGVNPIVTFPGEGTILYGDKTMLAKPSAFDRINVRRLFIVLEKAITRAARYSLFEFNDEFTRAQFVALIEPFLRDVQGRRDIYDFRVVCDTTNNTPEVIDRNEFIGDIYIKPARAINFIQLNFVAVRTGVAFEEIVGKFG